MQLSGKHLLNADRLTIWNLLMNPEILAKVIPGISKLESLGEHRYTSLMEIKLGPVTGSFTGKLELYEIIEEKGFTLKTSQNSKIGNANAVIKLNLTSRSDLQTEVIFDGDVKMTGILANMGQRLIGGIANTLIKQFFTNLEKELEKQSAA